MHSSRISADCGRYGWNGSTTLSEGPRSYGLHGLGQWRGGRNGGGGPGWMGLLGLSDLLHRLGLVQPHQVDYQVDCE